MSAEIMYRGYILKCRFCRNADWFDPAEVARTIRCKRCGRVQVISAENYWYGVNEPGWFYKLDEIVYQFLIHNGYITALSLDYLRRRQEDSFLYTSDLELVRQGSQAPEIEADILCIQDGVITLGEAKKENRLGRNNSDEITTIRKYYQLAKQVGARALVFATFDESWSPQTQTNVSRIISDATIKVTLLARQELLLH
jgi:hypothetical protein